MAKTGGKNTRKINMGGPTGNPQLDQAMAQAMALTQAGRLAEADRAFRQVLAVQPNFAQAINGLGFVALAAGQAEAAAQTFQAAIAADPGFVPAYNNMATALVKIEKPHLAIPLYQRALELNPDYVEALANLGSAYRKLDQFEPAAECFEQASKKKPADTGIILNFADCCDALTRYDEAEAACRRVLTLQPDNGEAYRLLASIMSNTGRLDEAIAAGEKAYGLMPDDPDILVDIGSIYVTNGHIEDARVYWRRALEVDAKQPEALRLLARHQDDGDNQDNIARMEVLFADQSLDEEARFKIGFGLGELLEKRGEFPKALTFIEASNTLRRKSLAYSAEATQRQLDRIAGFFSRETLEKMAGLGNPDKTPIFIVGMPRSGSTLIEQILASHADVFGAGELGELSRVLRPYLTSNGYYDLERIAADSGKDLQEIGRDYVAGLRRHHKSVPHITDKMPSNFVWAGLIKLILPNAKIIHSKRDAADTCLSIYKNLFAGSAVPFGYDFNELGAYYRGYEKMMAHWHEVMPGAIFDVQYEELVADQEGVTRAMLDYLDLEWDPAVLDFAKTERPVRTASVAQVRRGLYSSSVKLAEKYGDGLKPLFDALEGKSMGMEEA